MFNPENFKAVSMDDIMTSCFGEESNTLRAEFKKTINVRQYETEVFDTSSLVEISRPLCGIERMIATAILQVQLEYSSFIILHTKGLVSDTEFNERKSELVDSMNLIKYKGETLLNKPLDYLFKAVSEAEVKSSTM